MDADYVLPLCHDSYVPIVYARLCGASVYVALCESGYNYDRPRELGLLH